MSVAPNLTEILFAAGAADQVVGVSAYSDYPEAARALPQIGDAFRLDYERIVALAPTVAVVWESGTPAGVAERLEGLGIRVVGIPTRKLDEIATGLLTLGSLAHTEPVARTAAAGFPPAHRRTAGAVSGPAEASAYSSRSTARRSSRSAAPT